MIVVRYSRLKLFLSLLVFAGIGWFGLYAFEHGKHRWVFLGAILMFVAAVWLPFALRYLASSAVLSIDARGLRHHGLFGSSKAAWREIEAVNVIPSTSRLFDTTKLQVRGPLGLFRRCEVLAIGLGGEYRSIEAVLAAMQMAQQGHLSDAGPAVAPRASAQLAPHAGAAPAARGGFGRKGLN